jgi:hypothetical protein
MVPDALNQPVTFAYTKKLNFPGWYSSTLKYCANKKVIIFVAIRKLKRRQLCGIFTLS